MGYPKSESPRGDPIIPIDGCTQCLQGEDDSRLDGDLREDVRKTLGLVFLMKKLFNPKMADNRSVTKHINKFIMLTS